MAVIVIDLSNLSLLIFLVIMPRSYGLNTSTSSNIGGDGCVTQFEQFNIRSNGSMTIITIQEFWRKISFFTPGFHFPFLSVPLGHTQHDLFNQKVFRLCRTCLRSHQSLCTDYGKFVKFVLSEQTVIKIEFSNSRDVGCFDCLYRLLVFLNTLQISH